MSQWQTQTIARVFGAMYLVTFATSIPALILFQPVLDDPAGYIAGGGSDTRIYFGAFLELLLIVSNIATAVVLVPLLRRQDEIFTFGYVTARIMECVFIAIGIICVLGIVSLRADDPDAGCARHVARRAQGLDVPARAGLHGRHRERADPRLPDVPVRPHAAAARLAGAHRRPAHHPLRDRGAVRPL